jgi:transglutaminase-like putative cysteine protease
VYDARSILTKALTSPPPLRLARASRPCLALLVAFCAGCAAPSHADPGPPTAGALDTPDAVYELWEQDWTLRADGTRVYHDKRHLRLNSDRVFRAFGNPRITYNTDTDQVEVLVARTRLPGGEYVALADYSTVEVSPDAAAGWPAFANVCQKAMVMGGIEPGCVLELEYKITTNTSVGPYLAADLRIDNTYPVRSHAVTVTVPRDHELAPVVSGLPEDGYAYAFEQRSDGSVTHRWVFPALDAAPSEPQSLPWQERGVRLSFTTAPDADTWIRQRLAMIDTAADESPLLTKLAQEWTKEETADSDKLRALQKKLSGSFNFVNFDVAWRPPSPRRASDVIYHNYGLPAESAAVLIALARAAGIATQPALLVADGVWDANAPQAAMVAAYVVTHVGPDGVEIWHPKDGRVRRDKRWAGHTLLSIKGSSVTRTALSPWRSADASRCAISGNITISEDGKYTGKLSIKTTGLFVSPGALDTRDGQKGRIKTIVNHVLPDAKLVNFTLKSLTPDTFEVEAEVESSEALEKLHDCYHFELPQTSPAFVDVSVPLAHSRRATPARLSGTFDERCELTITWPETWDPEAIFSALEPAEDRWGSVLQSVTPTKHGVKLTRRIRIAKRDLPPGAVIALRDPLNELRSDHARTLLLRP